jgi:hypothetical protein
VLSQSWRWLWWLTSTKRFEATILVLQNLLLFKQYMYYLLSFTLLAIAYYFIKFNVVVTAYLGT